MGKTKRLKKLLLSENVRIEEAVKNEVYIVHDETKGNLFVKDEAPEEPAEADVDYDELMKDEELAEHAANLRELIRDVVKRENLVISDKNVEKLIKELVDDAINDVPVEVSIISTLSKLANLAEPAKHEGPCCKHDEASQLELNLDVQLAKQQESDLEGFSKDLKASLDEAFSKNNVKVVRSEKNKVGRPFARPRILLPKNWEGQPLEFDGVIVTYV